MANRHLSRSIAIQTLFEWDFRGCDSTKIDEAIDRIIREFGPKNADVSFVRHLVLGVIEQQVSLDQIIEKAAKDWPIAQTSIVDRNVLRLGLFELLFSAKDEVPARVAINEAIELAKSFGGEKSGKFVNGVLGTVYKEIGEPGKHDVPKQKFVKKKLTPEEREKLPLERLGGAVVYTRDSASTLYLAFVHDIFGFWTLSKGRIEAGENEREATVREIKEEMGVEVKICADLGRNEYIASDPKVGKKRKQVTYYLAEAPSKEGLHLENKGGLDDARWFSVQEVLKLKTYEDITPIIKRGIEWLNNNPVKPATTGHGASPVKK